MTKLFLLLTAFSENSKVKSPLRDLVGHRNALTENVEVTLAKRENGAILPLAFCDVFEMDGGKIRRLISYLMETQKGIADSGV